VNTVIVLRATSSIATTPVNGTSYSAGQTISGVTVLYSGAAATDTSVTQSGLTVGTTYYYKAWAKAGPGGACTTAPCYVGGSEQSFTPGTGGHAWSSIVVGGAALNPAVAGTGRMSLGTSAGKLVSVDSTTGAWTGVPANMLNAMQGYVSVFPFGGGEMVVGGDQSGWVYAVNPATGAYYWVRQLGADTIQAAVSPPISGAGLAPR
jgi:outer membrane protein assembly factor BamB